MTDEDLSSEILDDILETLEASEEDFNTDLSDDDFLEAEYDSLMSAKTKDLFITTLDQPDCEWDDLAVLVRKHCGAESAKAFARELLRVGTIQ
jgi:hypothetical protein